MKFAVALLLLVACGRDVLIADQPDGTVPCCCGGGDSDGVPAGDEDRLPGTVIIPPQRIQDAMLYSNHPDMEHWNFGGLSTLAVGYSNAQWIQWSSVVRLDETQIPGGDIAAFRLKLWRFSNEWSQMPNRLGIYRVSAANDWAEGSTDHYGEPEAGAVDWFDTAHGSRTWAGSPGCRTPGVDYEADGAGLDYQAMQGGSTMLEYAAMLTGEPLLYVIDLPTRWAIDWRDGMPNNGVLFRERDVVSNSLFVFGSSESDWSLSFEIDTE